MNMAEFGDITDFECSLVPTGIHERRAAAQARRIAFGHLCKQRGIRIELAMEFVNSGRPAASFRTCQDAQRPPRSKLSVLQRAPVTMNGHRPARTLMPTCRKRLHRL